MSEVQIGFNCHGKGRVRLVKVIRNKNGTQDVVQVNVQLLLEGRTMDEVFLTGNNANCVPTDTCKNTVYCLAKLNDFTSIEDFGLIIGKHFLNEYPDVVHKITVDIKKDVWERIISPDKNGSLKPHAHAFRRYGTGIPFTKVVASKSGSAPIQYSVTSGIRGVDLLKTTQSGFVGFHTCKYTSLEESTDRLLGTSMDAEWSYDSSVLRKGFNFNDAAKKVVDALIFEFVGPASTGVYSKSVQETLYLMAKAALKRVPSASEITLQMPNIHNIAFPLEKYGIKNADHTGNPDIFFPIDEPHGMIKATIHRTSSSVRSRL